MEWNAQWLVGIVEAPHVQMPTHLLKMKTIVILKKTRSKLWSLLWPLLHSFVTFLYYIFLFSNVGFPLFETLLKCWSFRWSLHKLVIINQHFHRPKDWIFLVASMQLYNPQCWSICWLDGPSEMHSLYGIFGQFSDCCSCPNIRLAFFITAPVHLHKSNRVSGLVV